MFGIHAYLALIMILLIGSHSAFAASNTPVCPPEIQVEQKVIGLPADPPKGEDTSTAVLTQGSCKK